MPVSRMRSARQYVVALVSVIGQYPARTSTVGWRFDITTPRRPVNWGPMPIAAARPTDVNDEPPGALTVMNAGSPSSGHEEIGLAGVRLPHQQAAAPGRLDALRQRSHTGVRPDGPITVRSAGR